MNVRYRILITHLVVATVLVPHMVHAQTTPTEASTGISTQFVDEPGGQILSFRPEGTTVVDMRGTKIEPGASCRLKVESRPGFVEIDINRGEIKGLTPAYRFGKDFLTYVLWAVSVDGDAQNLGEITFDNRGPVSINITTPYQTFWLMVTAEPDFAVNDPSPVVVLYSINQNHIEGSNKALPVDGRLLYHSYYSRYDTSPAAIQRGIPNELLQARKAIELAGSTGILSIPTPAGEEPLPDEERTRQTLRQAQAYLQQAEEAMSTTRNRSDAIQFARTAVQIAENARALSLGAAGGLYARRLDRQLSRAHSEIETLTQDNTRLSQENARLSEEVQGLREPLRNTEAELARLRAVHEETLAKLESALADGTAAGSRLAQLEEALSKEQSLRSDATQRLASLEHQVETLSGMLEVARDDRDKICAELRRQLSSLGQLTEQGGNMVLTLASDILFDFGSAELRPTARENLAKLSGVRTLLFPQADVRYVGHTDLVGDETYNQWLSEQRALAVLRFFLEEEVETAGGADTQNNKLSVVNTLLTMPYRQPANEARRNLLATLGDTVVGKGESEPVEITEAASERNRRVVLLFPPAQPGQASSLCAQASHPDPDERLRGSGFANQR